MKIKKYVATPEALSNDLEAIDEISVSTELQLPEKTEKLMAFYHALSDEQKKMREGRYIIMRIGEVSFQHKDYPKAFDDFAFATRFKDTIGNPFLHLRLGQIQHFLNEHDRVADELSRALIMGGKDIFEDEPDEFFAIPNEALDPPEGGWENYPGQDWETTK